MLEWQVCTTTASVIFVYRWEDILGAGEMDLGTHISLLSLLLHCTLLTGRLSLPANPQLQGRRGLPLQPQSSKFMTNKGKFGFAESGHWLKILVAS